MVISRSVLLRKRNVSDKVVQTIKTDILYSVIIFLEEVEGGCGDWMELAQDRDRWRALVSTVMNLWVPKMRGIS